MSYVDRNSNNPQKALAGTVVALIQGGIVLALINGFAVHFLPEPPRKHTEGVIVPLAPLPKPSETPSQVPEPIRQMQPKITAPKDPIPLDQHSSFAVPESTGEPISAGDSTTGKIDPLPPIAPPEAPRFQPQAPMPRGSAGDWVSSNDYPSIDLRAEHQGLVKFRLDVGTDGKVQGCTIVASSGFSGLDAATCKNVSRRARFTPATNAEGQKVPGSFLGTIRWIIPRD